MATELKPGQCLLEVFNGADGPCIWKPLTTYGLLVRALRVAAGTTLMEMSEWTGYTPSYLSGVEFGRKPLTKNLIVCTHRFFHDKGIDVTLYLLQQVADSTAKDPS